MTVESLTHRDQPRALPEHGAKPLAGWGGRIRTVEYGFQRPAPYRLATPQDVSKAGTPCSIDLRDVLPPRSRASRFCPPARRSPRRPGRSLACAARARVTKHLSLYDASA